MDYISCGYPDLSYHGESAWRPQTENYHRHIGMMLCGKYAEIDGHAEDAFLYFAINMHWESHELALPKLPKGMYWKMVFATEDAAKQEKTAGGDNTRRIAPRSIAAFIGVPQQEKKEQKTERQRLTEK